MSSATVLQQLAPAFCPETSEIEKQVISTEAPEVSPEGSTDKGNQSRMVQLLEGVRHREILEGRDALEYLRSLRASHTPAQAETRIDIESLERTLACHIPKDTHLTRRARKLASQIGKGRELEHDWDCMFLSELTAEEKAMSDTEFLARYPDDPKPVAKRGGRPRKYKTLSAEKKAHAERQQRYRERILNKIAEVTKTPLHVIEN